MNRFILILLALVVASLLRAAEIHDAVLGGDMAKVITLLKQTPALVSQQDSSGDQPLHLAAKQGNAAIIKQLLDAGADVNAKGAKGWTPLHYAGASDNKEACLALLENGANRDAVNQASQKPEQTARVFTKYVIQKYDPKMAGAGKLFAAIEAGEAEKAKELVAANPQILQAKDGQGKTPLVRAAGRNKPELVEPLLGSDEAADGNAEDRYTALAEAARRGNLDMVRLLLKHGAAVNPPRPPEAEVSTPLRAAAFTLEPTAAGAGASAAAMADMKFLPDGTADPAVLHKVGAMMKSISPDAFGGSLQGQMARLFKADPEPVREAKRVILRLLLDAGADPKKNELAILSAAMSGETEMVRLLLERGANPNAEQKGALPVTTIGGAVALGAPLPLIRFLLAAGADPLRVVNPKLPLGSSALHIAVLFKNEEVIDALLASLKPANLSTAQHYEVLSSLTPGGPAYLRRALDAGFKVNAKRTDGRTALMVAAAAGSAEAMEALLEAGADVNAQDEAGFTSLATAVERRRTAQVSALLAHGAKLELAIKTGQTPLFLAAGYGNAEIVELLLKAGAKATVVWAKDGSNALQRAANSGQGIKEETGFEKGKPSDYAAVVKLLLDAGLPVDRQEPQDGFTALHLAAGSGNVEAARLLLAKGAMVNAPSQDGRTPLHLAAGGSSIELVALLLDHQANINAVQSGHPGKSTPMMYAVQNDRVENLKLLLKRGADLKATFYGVGATALHVAAQQGSVEASKVLLDAGIKIDARDQYQMTPLISAVTAGQRGVAELLIKRGADVNASMARNITALQTAMGKGDSAMISFLKAHGAKE